MSARPSGIKRMQHSLSMRRASKARRAHSEVCRAAEPRSPYSAATSRQVPRFKALAKARAFSCSTAAPFPHATRGFAYLHFTNHAALSLAFLEVQASAGLARGPHAIWRLF